MERTPCEKLDPSQRVGRAASGRCWSQCPVSQRVQETRTSPNLNNINYRWGASFFICCSFFEAWICCAGILFLMTKAKWICDQQSRNEGTRLGLFLSSQANSVWSISIFPRSGIHVRVYALLDVAKINPSFRSTSHGRILLSTFGEIIRKIPMPPVVTEMFHI